MSYVDPQTVHDPATGTSPPALWGDTVRNNLQFLARPPGCVVQTAAAQSAATATWTTIAWNGADLRDTDGFHATDSAEIVIPAGLGGWYNLSGVIGFAASNAGFRMARYTLDGVGDNRLAQLSPAESTGNGTLLPFSRDVLLTAGTVLRFSAWQNSGAALDLGAGMVVSVRLVALAS